MLLPQYLFQWNSIQALDQISTIYQQQWYCVVSYVYGAVIVRHNLLDHDTSTPNTDWQKSLVWSDIILPDGAALRTYRRIAQRLWIVNWVPHLSNINGTDFFPYLLEQYLARGSVNLLCYAVYDEKLWLWQWHLLREAEKYLQSTHGIWWTYAQDTNYDNDDMNNWDRDAMSRACDPTIPTLMMVCRGVPRQEIWSYHHREQLRKYGIIACNQWATIDYRAGRETRAPLRVRTLWLESIWRLISDPRKNRSKFWVSFVMMWKIIQMIMSYVHDKVRSR